MPFHNTLQGKSHIVWMPKPVYCCQNPLDTPVLFNCILSCLQWVWNISSWKLRDFPGAPLFWIRSGLLLLWYIYANNIYCCCYYHFHCHYWLFHYIWDNCIILLWLFLIIGKWYNTLHDIIHANALKNNNSKILIFFQIISHFFCQILQCLDVELLWASETYI